MNLGVKILFQLVVQTEKSIPQKKNILLDKPEEKEAK